MLIDLSKVLAREGEQLTVTIRPEEENFSCGLGTFAFADKGSAELVILHKGDQKLTITGKGRLQVWIPCGRCLEPVKVPFDIEVNEEVDMRLSDQERLEALEESSFICEKTLDTEKLLHNELLIRWPMRVLCKEDCKGICSRCGANLNKETCNCDTEALDPRMAVISDIFKNFKEV